MNIPSNHLVLHKKMKTPLPNQTTLLLLTAVLFLLPNLSTGQNIACGGSHSLFLCTDGTANAWGWNLFGQLGNDFGNSDVPLAVLSLDDITDVSAGINHCVALKDDKTVWTWGSNITGELGNGLSDDSNIPVQVIGLSNITAISSNYHTLALNQDSTVSAWGYNTYGELGNGIAGAFSNVPVPVSELTQVTKIACAYYHSLALKSDSTIWGWGYRGGGALGSGATVNEITIPIQINGFSQITGIAGGNGFTLAIKNDSTVWAVGGNFEGELGNGANINTDIPVQVSGLTGITAVAAGVYHSLAIKSDGTVWAWGFNLYGQLGNSSNADSNIPVQVVGLTDVVEVAAGYAHSMALKSDGTLWSWGYNSFGQLGTGPGGDSNIPAQVTGLCQITKDIKENQETSKMSVFPNPFENEFTITGTHEKGVIILLDITGKEILRQKASGNTTQLNLQALVPGIYFVKHNEGLQSTGFKISKH